MNLLDTLTRAADEEQLQLNPLPVHAAAEQPDTLRRQYALLLSAVLTAGDPISDTQTRLMRLLLDALKLGDLRAALFEQARQLDPDTLLEAARAIRSATLAEHLLVDALVLLRLDRPLTHDAAQLVSELAAFLKVDEPTLARRAGHAADILGLAGDGPADGAAALLAGHWPRGIPKPLTAQALKQGLDGGIWYLASDLRVDFQWAAKDAVLVFENNATIETFVSPKDTVQLTSLQLLQPRMSFLGGGKVELGACVLKGTYDATQKATALSANGTSVEVTDCQFNTVNARSIESKSSPNFLVRGTIFNLCGNYQLDGGAIFLTLALSHGIDRCRFENCTASKGGAIYTDAFFVNACDFVNCTSNAYSELKYKRIGIFSTSRTSYYPSVKLSNIKNTSIHIGKIEIEKQAIKNSNFAFNMFGSVGSGKNQFEQSNLISSTVYWEWTDSRSTEPVLFDSACSLVDTQSTQQWLG